MPDLITNTSRASSHRAQIVSEAVVSAYIREITPSRRLPAPVAVGQMGQTSSRMAGRSPLVARGRSGLHAPQRRSALKVGAG
ncbi:MAG: hypothetical protein ABI355_14035 [Solirubrobacteraceae bacterium]